VGGLVGFIVVLVIALFFSRIASDAPALAGAGGFRWLPSDDQHIIVVRYQKAPLSTSYYCYCHSHIIVINIILLFASAWQGLGHWMGCPCAWRA
jgi:hypothetical protein